MVFYALGVLLFIAGGLFAARMFFTGDGDVPVTPTPDTTQASGDPIPETSGPQDGRVAIDVTGLPPGATVRLDGLPAGTFPLRLRRGSNHVLNVSAPGYEAREIRFTADADKRLRGNLRPGTGAVP